MCSTSIPSFLVAIQIIDYKHENRVIYVSFQLKASSSICQNENIIIIMKLCSGNIDTWSRPLLTYYWEFNHFVSEFYYRIDNTIEWLQLKHRSCKLFFFSIAIHWFHRMQFVYLFHRMCRLKQLTSSWVRTINKSESNNIGKKNSRNMYLDEMV